MNSDKVLNTRVSKKLYEKIASKAKKNRITISNFIRNLVEDTLDIHEDFHDAVDKKIKKFLSDSEKTDVVGYQEITLAKDTVCQLCDKELLKSEKVILAYLDNDSKIIICSKCNETSPNN